MAEVCHVCSEPALQPVTSELLSGASAITEDNTRLDIGESGFWWEAVTNGAFFDIRIFNSHNTSNCYPISTYYRNHENTKKRAYEQHAWVIEDGSFTPFVLSVTGGMGNAATICYKRLASVIATKHDQLQLSWLRYTLPFSFLCSAIQCIRGSHSTGGCAVKQLPPLDLVASETCFET